MSERMSHVVFIADISIGWHSHEYTITLAKQLLCHNSNCSLLILMLFPTSCHNHCCTDMPSFQVERMTSNSRPRTVTSFIAERLET